MKKLIPIAFTMVLALSLSACSSDAPSETDSTVFSGRTSDMIIITSPAAGEPVSSPLNVVGETTMTEETTINLESYGADGLINTESKWHTNADGTFDFGSTYYFIGGGGEGRIDVILLDADDIEIDRASVPVVFE
ncbi:MAG: hypothetical protein ACI9QC_000758 [Oceanicoccus sp.]|jgi:hypothetical protein